MFSKLTNGMNKINTVYKKETKLSVFAFFRLKKKNNYEANGNKTNLFLIIIYYDIIYYKR